MPIYYKGIFSDMIFDKKNSTPTSLNGCFVNFFSGGDFL